MNKQDLWKWEGISFNLLYIAHRSETSSIRATNRKWNNCPKWSCNFRSLPLHRCFSISTIPVAAIYKNLQVTEEFLLPFQKKCKKKNNKVIRKEYLWTRWSCTSLRFWQAGSEAIGKYWKSKMWAGSLGGGGSGVMKMQAQTWSIFSIDRK